MNRTCESMSGEKIYDYAHTLLNQTWAIYAYLHTYKGLCDNGKEYYETINQTPVYFTVTLQSLQIALMIELCKLYENDKAVMSIKKIYNICEQNQSCFPKDSQQNQQDIKQILAKARDFLDQYSTSIENLKKQRDSLWAHSDKSNILHPNDIEQQYPIMWGEIEDLLKFADDFLSSIIRCFEKSYDTIFYDSPCVCEDEVTKVLKLMCHGAQE